jgi:aminoglycoside phosphotransferase (APT) family kinase protein
MDTNQQLIIPQEKIDAVVRGLREAFGVTQFENIRRLTGGHTSALVFRIVVGGRPFLLRIIMRTDDPTCSSHFMCMRAAAEEGLAPHVWYASTEDRLSISDFIEAVPFPRDHAPIQMAAALRKLHALSPFPTRADHLNTTCTFLMKKGTHADQFIHRFRAANALPPDQLENWLALLAELSAVYPHNDPDMVSSHNDLFKPDNILFDGKRVWLVDWEAAFLNDRYADLAAVASLVTTSHAEEELYLHEYFGKPPDPFQRARFFFMQQVVHLFYTMAFLFLGSKVQPVSIGNAPELTDFHRRMWAGEVDLMDSETRIAYGMAHWKQLLRNTRQRRFQEALKIVSDGPLTA